MADTATTTQIFLARLVVILAALLILSGLLWYGFSAEIHQRIWSDIAARPGGPMTFRFILQPCMAAIAAFHDGLKDARLGRAPYLRTLLTSRAESTGRLRESLLATGQIILLGMIMDTIYQVTVLKTFYPAEVVLIAILLAFVPYLLLRGLFASLVRRWKNGNEGSSSGSKG